MRKYTHKLHSEFPNSNQFIEQARVVAIGASAGGLEALKSFFEGSPKNDTNAYVVIQHLSPDYKSMMGELLKKSTGLKIVEVSEGMEISPGHIYLIPPVNNLILENGFFHLKEKPKHQSLNLPIDMFFESLAKERKEQAIGIILSGTGSDGTRGARAIKENDGMIMVQEPVQAQFDGMPRSAIGTGLVDYVVPVESMGIELQNFLTAPDFQFETGEDVAEQTELMKILSYVDEKTGLDFREYKKSTLARRVARRVKVCKCDSLSEYYGKLKSDKKEIEILYHEFLIGVTKFFRDSSVWQILRSKVIPELVKEKETGSTLKVWDVACSTGEEAYSLAMCIYEEIERQNKTIELKIFATDISEKHLEAGSAGCYPESIAADVPHDFLIKYFVSNPRGYKVVEKLRKSVVFSAHNIIKNPPFSNMDMVVCRNLLIYFQTAIQKKALHMLHYALKKEGILVLGTSENVQSKKDEFLEIDRKWKIYQNISPNKRLDSGISAVRTNSLIENRSYTEKHRPIDTARLNPVKKNLRDELHESILEQFGGASVFVDSEFNIMEALGEFRKYANLPKQGFSVNLLDMMGADLKYVIQNTLRKAKKLDEKVYYKNAIFEHQGQRKGVDIIVKPNKKRTVDSEDTFVITFIEKELNLDDVNTIDTITLTGHTKEYVSNLEEELKQTKEDLQTSLEEIETSNEELQAANEELLASNEELQSTNEELQSVNEEINTVNAENIQKMEDLEALNTDMNNLLESTQIGTIFLDSSLCIRKFTPAITQHFNLINADIGRPITHFTGSMGKNNLLERCKKVLESGKVLEKVVVSRERGHYLRRISPYRNSRDEIKGVVITFIDVETLQKSREKLLASERRYKSFYEEDPIMHISVNPGNSQIVHCNEMAVTTLGYGSKEELVGLPLLDLYSEEGQIEAIKTNKRFQDTGELVNLEQNLKKKSGEVLPVILNATAERDEEDNLITIRYSCVDISALKKAEDQLKQQKSDLERANRDLEQFVSICTHDLQEPLSTIKFGSDVLGKIYAQNLDDKGKNYIKYIEEASNRLSAQIKALLEHSRIGRNGKKKKVNTQKLVEIVQYDLGKRIRDTKAEIHVGSLPQLMGYEVELRLLFQNLISNAIKYTPDDRSPEIRISAYREGKHWVFSIMDNGVGISQDNLKNIFTIFNRVDKHKAKDGTGVGLAHVEKIVLLHEGNIWVESQEGVGSTFYFKLKA
ncbi:CheR family methyltransferase [Salinimicrobium sp. GXAS 041]|uniref:CheR family methyltransferase n=1 Tax=Salinimicrobium sp. GXAS 041 TaxID=3400806 RepID=UPI003C7695E0